MSDPTPAVIFDDGLGLLAPLRDLRPVFEARTGVLTTLERHRRALGLRVEAVWVPDALRDLAAEQSHAPVNELARGAGPVLLLSGRCPAPPAGVQKLGEGSALIELASGDVIAAKLDAAEAVALLESFNSGGPRPDLEEVGVEGRVLMTRPWHVRTGRDHCIDLDLRLIEPEVPNYIDRPNGVICVGHWPPRVAESAEIYPGVIFNTEAGTIAVHSNAAIRPGAVLTGPCSVGPGSTVLENAVIKPNTAIGPGCKVGGEIGGTIIQGFSNKAHEGCLGDSWLGEWVNLGAGTTVSNLLNTYGEVKAAAAPGGEREPTGETFLGCVLGDHVKTAIGTRVMTGAVAHTGAMWADPAPLAGCVEPFCWAAPGERGRFRPERALETARAMMQRRRVQPGPAYEARLRALADDA